MPDTMDALDMRILRTLGMEPFVGWIERPNGLTSSAVAQALGVGVQRVKDRIARMTADAVITGYKLRPNLRHCGRHVTVYHLRSASVPHRDAVAGLGGVDGFSRVVWFLDSGLCVELSHASDAERRRRIQVLAKLAGDDGPPKIFYTIDFPRVERELSDLDWRIIRALAPDAKRPIHEVAQELGVTTKTVRTRLNRMRQEGSVDEYATLDFTKLEGVIPFQLGVWFEPGASPRAALLDRFHDRLLAHFDMPHEDAYSSFMLRLFAYTPADVQAIVREALDVPGVARAEAMVATGGWENEQWLDELLEAHAPAPVP